MQARTISVYIVFMAGLVMAQGCSGSRHRVIANLPEPALDIGRGSRSTPARFDRSVPPRTYSAEGRSRDSSMDDSIPAHWYPPVADRSWRTIVIHHSAGENGSAASFHKAHRARGWDELGYHFVIGNGRDRPDGLIEVGPRWKKQKHGAHCKTPGNFYNDYGIGICLVGNLDNHPPTGNQLRSLKKLLLFLSLRYDIPAAHVYGHGQLKHTKCPGRYISVSRLGVWLEGKRQIWASSR